ncbi:MAG: Xaa-Pro peptidase family protein [Puniceicoccales bacterium]|jgi:Xaa-Pro aminopeptidase|nr:Xaa-Pro peptidase family protein [Puniceicoccales bacterium]
MDDALLIFSSTEKDSDLRYLVGAHIPDDIAVVLQRGKTTALVGALEINRLKTSSKLNDFVSFDAVKQTVVSKNAGDADVLIGFLKKLGLRKFSVKRNFPVYYADELRSAGFALSVADFSTLPQRAVKSADEIAEIRRAARIVQCVFSEVNEILSAAQINGKRQLVLGGEALTSESLRDRMENSCYRMGAIAENTIVACGIDACDPHAIGHGPLMANEFIVVDFFPRLRESGYCADVSRTFIRGRPSDAQLQLHSAVEEAHDMAIGCARDGICAGDITEKVFAYFASKGYESSKVSDPPRGMFHGLGHGFGLDIHEPPRIGDCSDILRTGMVTTIEPGLYYREIGGVRIEDDILIGDKSSEVLTQVPRRWIID